MTMPVISVRVDEETKAAMDERKTVNWSAVLRERIKEELADDRERDLARAVMYRERIQNASRETEGRDTTEIIREFREMSTEERREKYS